MINNLAYTVIAAGQKISVRLIKKDDVKLLVDLFYHLSANTKWLRFHALAQNFSQEQVWQQANAIANFDEQKQAAVVATIGEEHGQEELVGVAHFVKAQIEDTEAESAIVIRDDFQRRGVGKHLLRLLGDLARQQGITHLTGWVMPENIYLLRLLKQLDIKFESETQYGVIRVRSNIVGRFF